MTCREIVDFLMDYHSGELAATERRRFDDHLAECPECVEYMRTYVEAIRIGRFAYSDDAFADSNIPEELVRAILDTRLKHDD